MCIDAERIYVFVGDEHKLGQSDAKQPRILYSVSLCQQEISHGSHVSTASLTIDGIATVWPSLTGSL